MFKKGWSNSATMKMAAVAAALAALLGAGFVVPVSASAAGGPCRVMPDGTCVPVEYTYIEQDGTHIFGPEGQEIARQMMLDMPITTSGTPEHPVIAVDRKQIHSDVLPYIDPKTNRTMVPLRFIAEALGAEVGYDAEKAIIRREGLEVLVWFNTNKAMVNGKEVYLDAPAVLVPPGRTMVPLRFISEAFGCKVDWVGADGPDDPRVTIWKGGKYQIWIWAPWGFWGPYSLGDRAEVGNWNLRYLP